MNARDDPAHWRAVTVRGEQLKPAMPLRHQRVASRIEDAIEIAPHGRDIAAVRGIDIARNRNGGGAIAGAQGDQGRTQHKRTAAPQQPQRPIDSVDVHF